MEIILAIVLIVDAIMISKFLGSMIRARFNPLVYINTKFWARVGFLIIFHVVMTVISLFVLYIGAIVRAAM